MVPLVGLPVLAGVAVVLGLLAAAAPVLPARAIAPATAGLCLVAVALGLAMVAAGGQSQLLGGRVAVDPLSAFFVVLPGFAGFAAACSQLGRPTPGALPGLLAAALLVVLAGDARAVVLGAAVFALAGTGWQPRLPALAGVFLLAAALAVLSTGTGATFALMRASPPEGAKAAAVLVLTLLGVAPLAGWAPWHRPFLALHTPTLPMAAIGPVVGLYLAIRILADLCGPATPGWWGLPMLLVGAASAGFGVVAALRAPVFGGVLAGLAVLHGGWMLAGLGVAAVARSADVLPLATLALGGAMLHALNYAVFASLALVCVQAAATGAGSLVLDRLGGLAGRMPVVAVGLGVAGLSLALLPPGAGFASGWMVLQALFAAPRIGGLSMQLVVAATVAVLGLSAGFGAVACIRMGGMACLGRPRSPRAAAADDARPAERMTIGGLAGLCGLLGLFPGVALRLSGDAQHWVTSAGLDGQGGWTGVRTQLDSPGYLPLAIAVLLVVGVAATTLLARRLPSPQAVAPWEDGFAAPPPWMPFGDPATQVTAAALASTLPTGPVRVPALPRIRLRGEVTWPVAAPRRAAIAVLALAVLALLLVAVIGPA